MNTLDNDVMKKPSYTVTRDSWSISVFKRARRVIIEAQDYHVGPLTLTRDEVVDLAQKMGLHVRTRNRKEKF